MKKSSAAQINEAVDRVPRQSSVSIKQVLANARRLEIEALVQACEAELQARGSLDLTTEQAELTSTISARIAGKTLAEVIGIAFEEVPARPEERLVLGCISQNPGISHAKIGTVYRNRDLSLVIGHLVHDRFGYFRPLLNGPVQSDLLLERNKVAGKVCYTLRPEAQAAFGALGILDHAPQPAG